jgi:hypothetical protein
MRQTPNKVKLVLQNGVGGEPTYYIASITGVLWVSTSEGNFRVGQTLTEAQAKTLTENRWYSVTTIPAK